ncbi:UNVERIFIED_CONTAM: hypothetical protein Sangu_2982000 [Sesamum angustifolium]|uniref:Uncharacterized protein n=1 Tax=Sesamum angustifolium TaxID=2727405 RepID=A0AAW2IIA3_9LAMI
MAASQGDPRHRSHSICSSAPRAPFNPTLLWSLLPGGSSIFDIFEPIPPTTENPTSPATHSRLEIHQQPSSPRPKVQDLNESPTISPHCVPPTSPVLSRFHSPPHNQNTMHNPSPVPSPLGPALRPPSAHVPRISTSPHPSQSRSSSSSRIVNVSL